MSLNHVVQMGRFTADPELKTTTQNGKFVCSFSLAVDKPFNKENQHPEADFFDYEAWGNTAETICKYFHKGSRIIVDGRLTTNIWENKDGKKQKKVKIVVSNFNFVDKRSDEQGQVNTPQTLQETSFEDLDENAAF